MSKRKRRPGKRFKWSEAELRQIVVEMTHDIHTGPKGEPGPPGPMGVAGHCTCYQPLRAPWQQPVISNVGDNSPSMMDGGKGYSDTKLHVAADTYTGLSAVSVGFTCGCTWVGLSHEQALDRCPTHLDGWRK